MSEIFVQSLCNRVNAMNTLWERAVADLTPAQINHHERAGVLPLAFSFSHFIRGQDAAISRAFLGEQPLWEQANWAARTDINVDQLGREETVAEMEQLRIGDLDAWRGYQSEVIARTARVLEGITEEVLAQVLMPVMPENMHQTFCFLVVGPGKPLRRLEVLECFVYQHGLRHMGEVEHGRALVGLGGMTS
jgi:hypothetical protein